MAYFARRRIPIAVFLNSRRCVRYMSEASAHHPSPRPWFLRGPQAETHRQVVSRKVDLPEAPPPPPADAPEYIINIHSLLSAAPAIDSTSLRIGPPVQRRLPTHPDYQPLKGKRKRGLRYAGEGFDEPAGFWKWVVVAQVKPGTEGRGSVEAVLRSTRKMLRENHPDVTLPPRPRREASDGWAMLDLGETAVHILSRTAREKWFPDEETLERDPAFDMRLREIRPQFVFDAYDA